MRCVTPLDKRNHPRLGSIEQFWMLTDASLNLSSWRMIAVSASIEVTFSYLLGNVRDVTRATGIKQHSSNGVMEVESSHCRRVSSFESGQFLQTFVGS